MKKTKPEVDFTFNVTEHWYLKIKSGEKRVEYREVKKHWNDRLARFVPGNTAKGKIARIALGYSGEKYQYTDFEIVSIRILNNEPNDLNLPHVYAIEFKDIISWVYAMYCDPNDPKEGDIRHNGEHGPSPRHIQQRHCNGQWLDTDSNECQEYLNNRS